MRRFKQLAALWGWLFTLFVAMSLVACQEASLSPNPNPNPNPSATALGPLSRLGTPSPTPTATPTLTPTPTPTPLPPVRFAVIGDFGQDGSGEAAVAELVKDWNPDFIVTTGDNNYPNGSKLTFEKNVMKYYGDYVREERFFPVLGNHDWGYYTPNTLPFPEFFPYLPGNKRYYDLVRGPVHFFMLDSDPKEPDGITPDSKQGRWLQERLKASTAPWQVVVFHHAPYSSGWHGDTEWMQWPFAEWGVDLVLNGHDHTYERVHRHGIVYIVNGLGGKSRYEFEHDTEGSQVRYNEKFGALFIVATQEEIRGQFVNVDGKVIDEFVIRK